ncbi:heterokaryon incompatibility protein-domain-containing protein [Xylaria flabelliformis]|nr:heterokaryon incompatibility protein-domain-containing protein [Xylaria flabelliformis]
MTEQPQPVYKPLPNATSIRVLLLAPGAKEDDELFCWLVPSDLAHDDRQIAGTTTSTGSSFEERVEVFRGCTANGAVLEFPVSLAWGPVQGLGTEKHEIHSFQSYTALSYVWGDISNPQKITVNGFTQVSITRNLYDFLRSLRGTKSGRRLWCDALCIDQSNEEEKRSQIAMMRRIYQQAQKVLAYIPLPLIPDMANLVALGQMIVETTWRCQAARAKHDKDPELTPEHLNSGFNTTTKAVNRIGKQAGKAGAGESKQKQGFFLEDFGLPPADSPLWTTWRKFLTSDYFSRVWILQEFVLAPSVLFWLGQGGIEAESIMEVLRAIKVYSGESNQSYTIPPDAQIPDDAVKTKIIRIPTPFAQKMIFRRMHVRNGEPKAPLVDILRLASNFEATDPRDKIYGVLGLASDRDAYTEHISYAAGETYITTFLRFARLIVERGDGFRLLLQVNFFEPDSKDEQLPSWVPRWMKGVRNVLTERLNASLPEQMRVLADDRTLVVRGALVDEIEHICDTAFGAGVTYGDQRGDITFTLPFIRSCMLIESVFGSRIRGDAKVSERVFRDLFDILTQPSTSMSSASSQEASETGSSEASSKGSTAESPLVMNDEGETRDMNGFRWVVDSISLWLQAGNELDASYSVFANEGHPELRIFLSRVFEKTGNRRLCITKTGRIGIVPNTTVAGDHIALFDGCDNPFVLRRVINEEELESPRLNTSGDYHSLIGASYIASLREVMNDFPNNVHIDIYVV